MIESIADYTELEVLNKIPDSDATESDDNRDRNCWFSFATVFQWCCSTPQGSPGVGRNTLFLSSPHLCFFIVFICDLFVSRDDPFIS